MTAVELYGDLLYLERPVHDNDLFSRVHPKMARGNRAKLFAPFAALSGFDSCIRKQEIPYEPRRILCAWEKQRLDRALHELCGQKGARAEAVYFEACREGAMQPDQQLGLYRQIRGTVRLVDPVARILRIDDAVIPFEDIYRLAAIHP